MNNRLNELSSYLEKKINKYDKVLFFETIDCFLEFYTIPMIWNREQKVLFLIPESPLSEMELTMLNKTNFYRISQEDIDLIVHLYYTYEFSDKFIFFPKRNTNYPTLYHFIDCGILSRQEVFEILLR